MQCLILAGGLGTRLRPVTETIPKAMVEVGGHPFVHHQLALLAASGVRRVVFAVGYRGEMLRRFVGTGEAWNLGVDYVDEGERLRGTGGAVRLAVDSGLLDPGFLVLYGDSYLPIPLHPLWARSRQGRQPVMTVLRNAGRWDRSNVRFVDGRLELYDKRAADPVAAGLDHIDYGVSVLTAAAVREVIPPEEVADLADFYHRLSLEGRLLGHEVAERFYEVGSFSGLRDLEAYLAGRRRAGGSSP